MVSQVHQTCGKRPTYYQTILVIQNTMPSDDLVSIDANNNSWAYNEQRRRGNDHQIGSLSTRLPLALLRLLQFGKNDPDEDVIMTSIN